MKKSLWVGLLALGIGGCAPAFQWKLETRPAALGDLDWTRQLGTPMNLKTDGDTVYVATDQAVYAMKSSGAKVWSQAQPPAKRYLTVGEGKVVVTSYDLGQKQHGFWDRTGSDVNQRINGHVSAFNVADGAPLWDLAFDSDNSKLSPPTIAQGKVVVVSSNTVVAIDAATGKAVWTTPIIKDKGLIGRLNKASPFARVAPAVVDGKVCAAVYYRAAVLDLQSGQIVSEDRTAGFADAAPQAVSGACYIAADASSVRGLGSGKTAVWAVNLNAAKKHLKKLWTDKSFNDKHDLGIANLLLRANVLYAVSNFRVRAIDPQSGKMLWEVTDAPVFPFSHGHGVRTHQVARDAFGNSWNFSMDTNDGAMYNDVPGTGFVAGDHKVFIPAGYRADKKAPKHDVVTALDAKTGAYLGSYDAGGAIVLDLALTPDGTLLIATDQGLRSVRADSFTQVASAR